MEEPRKDVRHRRVREPQFYDSLPYRQETLYTVPSDSDTNDEMGKYWHLVSATWAGVTALTVLIISVLLHLSLYHGLPTPLTLDNIVAGEDLFITERAKADLTGLAQIGVKVVGSYENEVLALEYLRNHLLVIQSQVTNNKSVQIDVQRGSGAYHLSLKPQGVTNIYFNVANVIARLSDGNGSGNALLVNCHYDSHPSSPGAGDDGMNCAVMLEVLRVLSQSSTTLTHDVIFLFNGGEENPLQASHGFITNHTWAADVRAVLNYDSAGYGGRETLFQAGPNNPWLTAYYAYVPHPQGNSIVSDVFDSGMVPSDTDFRIFRDFGGIPGLDMAQIAGGYVYHTNFDDYQIIPDGTYQHTGDNMLALVKMLANAPELVQEATSGDAVFYDFLGLFFVRYTTTIAIFVNLAVILLSVYAPFRLIIQGSYPIETALGFLISAAAQMIGVIMGLGLAVLFAMICDWTDNAMSWFSKPVLTVGLFVAPALLPLFIVNWILYAQPIEQSRLGLGQKLQLNSEAITLFWAFVLLVSTICGIRSAYLIAMIVGFVAAANIIASLLQLQRRVRLWALVYIFVGLMIPSLYCLWIGVLLFSILPIMGRSGSQIIPDLNMSLMFGALTVMMGSFWAPMIGAVRRPLTVIIGLSVAAILTLMAVLLTPYGFPYNVDPVDPRPQRFWLIHAERTTYDIGGNVTYNDGGYWIQNLDRNSPRTIQDFVSELSEAVVVKDNCLDAIYCGMPLWKTKELDMLNKSIWVPAEAPTVPVYRPSTLTGAWNDTSGESRRLYLNISGSDHMRFFFAPRTGVTLTGWSLLDEIPTPNTWNGRSLYLVLYSYGMEPELPWQIWLDLTVPTGISPVIDINVNAHYLHNTTAQSLPYQSILDQLPVWVAPLHWTATYKSYIF